MNHTHFILMNGSEAFAVVERINAPYDKCLSEAAVKEALVAEFNGKLKRISIHRETDSDFIIEAEFAHDFGSHLEGYTVIINALPTWLYSINENYTESLENAIVNSDMVAVTCGNCGTPHLQKAITDERAGKDTTEHKCPECGFESDPSDFPDITKNIA